MRLQLWTPTAQMLLPGLNKAASRNGASSASRVGAVYQFNGTPVQEHQ